MTSLNQVINPGDQNSSEVEHVFGKYNYIQPQDSRQYLFCLTPRNDLKSNFKQLKGATNIGKLDIIWRTNMGDRGRLQTSQLQRFTVFENYSKCKRSSLRSQCWMRLFSVIFKHCEHCCFLLSAILKGKLQSYFSIDSNFPSLYDAIIFEHMYMCDNFPKC